MVTTRSAIMATGNSEPSAVHDASSSTDRFDFRLPHLKVSASSYGSNSVTPEPLLKGICGRVHFVPWTNFETIMKETLEGVTKIPPSCRDDAQVYFDVCRKTANRIYISGSHKSPPEIRESAPPTSCYARTTLFKQQDPRKCFDNSTSVDMERDIFEGVRNLLTGLHYGHLDFEFPTRQFSLIGHPPRRDSRTPTPDRALCIVDMNMMVAPPISSFEMKAPSVRLGEAARNICREEKQKKTPKKNLEMVVMKLCEGPRCEHEISAYGLCGLFNRLFAHQEEDSESSRHITKKKRMMIAQTIVQALTTQCGLAFLFTYETGIAFELSDLNEDGKIVIRTSSLFCCGNQMGVAAAILALSNYAVKKFNEDKSSLDRIARFAKLVVDAANFPKTTGTGSDSKTDGDVNMGDTNNSNDNTSGVGAQGKTVANEKAKKSKECSEDTFDAPDHFVSNTDISEVSETSYDSEDDIREGLILDYLYKHRGEKIGSGWSAIVFEVLWRGKKVALKVWSGFEIEAHEDLIKEVRMYHFIRDNSPSLLGTAVPNLIEAGTLSDDVGMYGSTHALAIELVGLGLSRDSRGFLWSINNRKYQRVELEDERGIYDAALKSLHALHEELIVHGDIALRNLRAMRVGISVTDWRVWWIDLGKARRESKYSQKSFVEEEHACALLFPCSSALATLQ